MRRTKEVDSMRKFHSLTFMSAIVLAVPMVFAACGDEGGDTPDNDAAGGMGTGNTGSGADNTGAVGAGANSSGGSGEGATGATSPEGGTGAVDNTGGMGGGGAGPVECDLSGDGKDHETIPQDVEDDLTLTADTVWTLTDFTLVHPGATLTIEPCTRIEGTKDPIGVLTIMQGAKIDAVGTADAPILFTSEEPEGDRAAGDWGGVVLLGKAPITGGLGIAEPQTKIYEGLVDADYTYGGEDEDDDSGNLSYVRIEYGGYELYTDKEINGLSMAAIGSATQVDHIMVSNTGDDCYEWWGGSVVADYLVCNNPGDDYFDADEGFEGGGSNWFGRRQSADAVTSDDPRGFEWDSMNDGDDPRTNVTVSNVTLCGTGDTGYVEPEFCMVLRELITGSIDDLACVGFEYGIDTRNAFADGDVSIDNSQFWEIANTIGAADGVDNDSGYDDAAPFDDGTDNSSDDGPFTLEDCQASGGPTSEVTGSEIGAFAESDDWMEGLWVDWSED
jgi:hypothetical protein